MGLNATFDATLAEAQRGVDKAFAALYRAYNPMVERYLRARLQLVDEDLASDIWIAVARHIKGFVGREADFRAWLFTLTRRKVIDRQRSSARSRTDAVDPHEFSDLPARDDPAGVVIEDLQASAAVAMLAARLTSDQADVILLRVLAGLDATEVATLMGHTENWVRVTQHRALRRLADCLDPKAVTA